MATTLFLIDLNSNLRNLACVTIPNDGATHYIYINNQNTVGFGMFLGASARLFRSEYNGSTGIFNSVSQNRIDNGGTDTYTVTPLSSNNYKRFYITVPSWRTGIFLYNKSAWPNVVVTTSIPT